MQTKTRTQSVTNTQLGVAVLAAFLAGALAFAGVPAKKLLGGEQSKQCTVASISFGKSCGKNKFFGNNFTCSNGSKIALGNKCDDLVTIKNIAAEACGKISCLAKKTVIKPSTTATTNNNGNDVSSVVVTSSPVTTSTLDAMVTAVESPASPATSSVMDSPEIVMAPVRNIPGPDLGRLTNRPIELQSCGTPPGGWQSYNTYVLTQNVQVSAEGAGSSYCFNIGDGVHDIVLDCQNYSISGQGVENAIAIALRGRDDRNSPNQYNEVRNCRIQNVRDGISLTSVHYTVLRGNTVDTSTRNALSVYGHNNIIENNTSINNKSRHIIVHNSAYTQILWNTVFTNTPWSGEVTDMDDGITLSGELSHDNIVENNTIDGVHGSGIVVSGAVRGTSVRNNSVHRALLSGVAFYVAEGVSNLNFSDNTFCSNGTEAYPRDLSCYNPMSLTGSGNYFTNVSGCSADWPQLGVHYNQCQ